MHELTKKIQVGYTTEKEVDSIITKYLKDIEKEIILYLIPGMRDKEVGNSMILKNKLDKILGLSEKEDYNASVHKEVVGDTVKEYWMKKEPQKKEWCEHWKHDGSYWRLTEKSKYHGNVDDIKYCCECGTARPIEKSLEERLAEKLNETWGRTSFNSSTFERLAETAIAFLKSEGAMK